jgi:hypothetical protein
MCQYGLRYGVQFYGMVRYDYGMVRLRFGAVRSDHIYTHMKYGTVPVRCKEGWKLHVLHQIMHNQHNHAQSTHSTNTPSHTLLCFTHNAGHHAHAAQLSGHTHRAEQPPCCCRPSLPPPEPCTASGKKVCV